MLPSLGPGQKPSLAGPSNDVVLQERCELFRNWRKFPALLSDLIEVKVHNRVDQTTHGKCPILTFAECEGWNCRNPHSSLHDRDLSVEIIQHQAGR